MKLLFLLIFQQLNDQLSQQSQSQEQRQQKRKCDLYMNILAIVMVLLQGNIDCGISIQYWLFVYFCIQSLMIGASFLDDYIRESQFFNQQHRSLKKFIKITKVILLEGSLCGWILYGNSMFNESNTCYEKVPILAYMMLFLLILGFFQLLLYAVIVAVIICYFAAQCKRDMRKQVGSVKILKSLTRTKFNYQLFDEADDCAICWNSYTEQDEVAKLKCNEKHYYHSACIESWIKAGNNTCPMCREPIDRNIQI